MTADSDDHGRVLEDHRTLLADARAVEMIVETESVATGDVTRRLETLTDNFARHVEHEIRSPMYTTVPEAHPDLADELGRLKDRHDPILEALRSATEACRHARELSLDSPVSIAIRRAVADVREHEAAEADIMQRISARSEAS